MNFGQDIRELPKGPTKCIEGIPEIGTLALLVEMENGIVVEENNMAVPQRNVNRITIRLLGIQPQIPLLGI